MNATVFESPDGFGDGRVVDDDAAAAASHAASFNAAMKSSFVVGADGQKAERWPDSLQKRHGSEAQEVSERECCWKQCQHTPSLSPHVSTREKTDEEETRCEPLVVRR